MLIGVWLVVEQLTKNMKSKISKSFLSVILIFAMLPPNGERKPSAEATCVRAGVYLVREQR